MNREERAAMLAHIWAKHVWPEQGDVKCLSLAFQDDDEDVGFGITVFGDVSVDHLADALVEALLGTDLVAPIWLAMTGTVYYDSLSEEEAAVRAGDLQNNPSPTTQHGLMVVAVDAQGVHSTCWKVELDPVIDLPEAPEWTDDGHPDGYIVAVLGGLFEALVEVAGNP